MGLVANNIVKVNKAPAPVETVPVSTPAPITVGPAIKVGNFVKINQPDQPNKTDLSVKQTPKPFKYADAPAVIPEKQKRTPKRTSTFMSHMTTK